MPSSRGPRTILEPVTPHPGVFDARAMARGEPGVPRRFDWRGRTYEVVEVLAMEREVSRSAPGFDVYVRRHVVCVRLATGEVMTLAGSRGAGGGPSRWVLRTVEDPGP